MGWTNPRVGSVEKAKMQKYIADCLENHGDYAKEYLDFALRYFKLNPNKKTFIAKVNNVPKEFWDALKVLSTKSEYRLFVKSIHFGKAIKFYANWPYYDDNWTGSPIAYVITNNYMKTTVAPPDDIPIE